MPVFALFFSDDVYIDPVGNNSLQGFCVDAKNPDLAVFSLYLRFSQLFFREIRRFTGSSPSRISSSVNSPFSGMQPDRPRNAGRCNTTAISSRRLQAKDNLPRPMLLQSEYPSRNFREKVSRASMPRHDHFRTEKAEAGTGVRTGLRPGASSFSRDRSPGPGESYEVHRLSRTTIH